MAFPALPFVIGVIAGSALTLLFQRRSGGARGPERRETDVIRVDAEPVEDTVGLEARYGVEHSS